MPTLSRSSALVDEAQDDNNNKDAELASLDPLDPRTVALDIFEVYCHEMVTTSTVGRRAFLIEKMRVSMCVSRNFHCQYISREAEIKSDT
jgi:hypothetical protein